MSADDITVAKIAIALTIAEQKLAKIRTCADKPGYYPEERLREIRRILNEDPS